MVLTGSESAPVLPIYIILDFSTSNLRMSIKNTRKVFKSLGETYGTDEGFYSYFFENSLMYLSSPDLHDGVDEESLANFMKPGDERTEAGM